MGGDHKCPVCQATFTRPQHVARHMRSHTGDRPYKCQFCGDQFARSDLLARHVNKCHANEKPAPGTQAATNNRRKGTASASRATTSKQACDQCVQSSLPCDGCNPCAKCVSRKCRCTYVKFHRQTAPAGPGHNPRPTSSHSSLASLAAAGLPRGALPHQDDFILGPGLAGPNPGIPYGGSAFSFPYANGGSDPQLSLDANADFSAKYRAQAELLRRAGAGAAGGSPSLGGSGIYGDPQAWAGYQQGGWNGSPEMSNSAPAPSYLHEQMRSHGAHPYGGGSDYEGGGGGLFYGRRRSDSIDFGGSDTSSNSHTNSIPSSAASSSLHLPLVGDGQHMGPYHTSMDDHPSYAHDQQQQHDVAAYRRHSESHPDLSIHASNANNDNGGFSSAFGLMSIDDPNVLNGMASDSAPFFSSAAMNMPPQDPNITPMPPKEGRGAPLRTPGLNRDMETRELRDFWKQYINQTPGEHPPPLNTHGLGLLSPLGGRRQRVNSLPSAKTPTADLAGFMNGTRNGGGAQQGAGRTLHGNADDLRSYEAAVLARKAPTLNLIPRKGVRGNASSASPPSFPLSMPGAGAGVGSAAHRGNYTLSRPSSSASSTTSSLAYALDRPARASFAVPQNPHSHSHSRDSSDGEPSSDRPSFKRLPSQTLGPPNAKRAALQEHDADVLPSMPSISRRPNGLPGPAVGMGEAPSIAAYAGAGGEVRDF